MKLDVLLPSIATVEPEKTGPSNHSHYMSFEVLFGWLLVMGCSTEGADAMRRMKVAALLLIFLLALPASAQPISDSDITTEPPRPRFQVINGNTVKFGPQLVRLFGIDAPERGQPCDDYAWWPGPLAKRALERFIGGRPVTCRQVDNDQRSNPPVAQCFAGDDDLQVMMVSAGWAWAFVRYSDRYAPEEKDARAAKLGVHGHRCQPAWEWRAQQRR